MFRQSSQRRHMPLRWIRASIALDNRGACDGSRVSHPISQMECRFHRVGCGGAHQQVDCRIHPGHRCAAASTERRIAESAGAQPRRPDASVP
jgi:hypothetical protein